MTTDTQPAHSSLRVSDLHVEIVRKDIKNLHLGVYPPDGRVRLAVPLRVDDETARLLIVNKLGWIRRQQARFATQARQSAREMVDGESHYVGGRRYRLRVVEQDAPPQITLRGGNILELRVRPHTDAARRLNILQAWYRAQLKAALPDLIAKWSPVLGVTVAAWGIKRMKTRWGTCNIAARRIWLNLELAKKSPQCLEYVLVHEMVHLLERTHNDRFRALMDRYLPQWQLRRAELNAAPLAHEEWEY